MTCLIALLAPLQFVSIIAQWIFSYVYGTTTFCLLALVVSLAYVTLNIVFSVMFRNKINSLGMPNLIDRKVRLDKMTKYEAKTYLVAKDL